MEEDVKNFVSQLLVKEVGARLGGGSAGVKEVKAHPWLKCLDWDLVDRGNLEPPLVPDVRHPGDGCQYQDYREEMWWDVHELPQADRDRFIGF